MFGRNFPVRPVIDGNRREAGRSRFSPEKRESRERSPQEHEELAASKIDNGGSAHETDLGNPRIQSAGNQEEPGRKSEEADEHEERNLATAGMPPGGEHEEHVPGVINHHGETEGGEAFVSDEERTEMRFNLKYSYPCNAA